MRYQVPDAILARELRSLLEIEQTMEQGYLVGLPVKFLVSPHGKLLEDGSWRYWRLSRRFLAGCKARTDGGEGVFGDAFIFRPESGVPLANLARLWNKKYVVLAVPNEQWFVDFHDKWPNSAWVPVPAKNAFSLIDSIEHEILQAASESSKPLCDVRVLIAAGPAAKVLVKNLAASGLVAYDVGNFFTWKFYGKEKRKNNERYSMARTFGKMFTRAWVDMAHDHPGKEPY